MLSLFKVDSFLIIKSICFTILFFTNFSIAQEKIIKFNIKKNPTSYNYWWLEKNNFGKNPSIFDLETIFEFKKGKSNFVINIFSKNENNKIENIYFNESFIKYNFSKSIFLRIGRYYKDFSPYLNDQLSSGSMLISQNAQAMPKVGLVTSHTIKKNKNFSFDFGIAHSSFDKNNQYNKAPLLHEKFIYLNYSNKNQKLGLGLVHEAVWSGETESRGRQPSSFRDFLKVFIAADGPYIEDNPHANALGNHLGIWDFYYLKSYNEKKIKFYYQHFFEDTSGLRFANKFDGLWGLELKNFLKNNTILVEYLDTTNQNTDPPYVSESYYKHGNYSAGWSYKDYTLGNPFMDHSNQEETAMIHLGLSGTIVSSNYRVLVSKRINFGDSIKYKVILSKKINPKVEATFFIVNSESNNGGIGLSINKIL
jgi:hypothetical protein|tara:strand:+ start:787 stop:2052 length:1266 start_codon:yes stop_codon:yes gene_type:complete